jgi:hypothetical protein
VVREVVPPFDEDRPRGPGTEHREGKSLATGRRLPAVGESVG